MKTFAERFNETVENSGKIFGFELFNIHTNEYEFDYITFNERKNTLNWNNFSIEVDTDMSVEYNIEGLYDEIMSSGIYE